MNVDAYGLIAQQDGDVGDSLHREAMVAFGVKLVYDRGSNTAMVVDAPNREPAEVIIDKFEVEPGIYVRHPDPSRWSSNPDTTSRDQLIPVIAYCAAYEDHERLWRLFKAVVQRGFFAQNFVENGPGKTKRKLPDTMLTHLSLFIRAGGKWTAPLYPLLLMTDSVRLAGTLLNLLPIHISDGGKRIRFKRRSDVDDNNRIIGHILAAEFKPTAVSWVDRMIYSWTRPKNFGNTVMGEANPVMGSLVWYHRAEEGGNPEIAELYRPLIATYFAPRDTLMETKLKFSLFVNRFYDKLQTTSL